MESLKRAYTSSRLLSDLSGQTKQMNLVSLCLARVLCCEIVYAVNCSCDLTSLASNPVPQPSSTTLSPLSHVFKRHTAHENGKQLHERAITRARKRTALDFLATVRQRASPPAKHEQLQRGIEAADSFRTDSGPRSNGGSKRCLGCWIIHMHNKSSFSNVLCSHRRTGTPV